MKRESTATSIVLMHELLEGRKSMKRLADFNCCRTSRRRVYSSHDLQGKYDDRFLCGVVQNATPACFEDTSCHCHGQR